jgi:hypothetical protein
MKDIDWSQLRQYRVKFRDYCDHVYEVPGSIKDEKILDRLDDDVLLGFLRLVDSTSLHGAKTQMIIFTVAKTPNLLIDLFIIEVSRKTLPHIVSNIYVHTSLEVHKFHYKVICWSYLVSTKAM